jgi:hypothetical protein
MSDHNQTELFPKPFRVRYLNAEPYYFETKAAALITAAALTDGDWSLPAVVERRLKNGDWKIENSVPTPPKQ